MYYAIIQEAQFHNNHRPGPVSTVNTPGDTLPKLSPGESIEPLRTNELRQKHGQEPYRWLNVSVVK